MINSPQHQHQLQSPLPSLKERRLEDPLTVIDDREELRSTTAQIRKRMVLDVHDDAVCFYFGGETGLKFRQVRKLQPHMNLSGVFENAEDAWEDAAVRSRVIGFGFTDINKK